MKERGQEQFLSQPERERIETLTEIDKRRIEILNKLAEMEAKKESLGGQLCENQRNELLSLEREIKDICQKMRKLGADWVK